MFEDLVALKKKKEKAKDEDDKTQDQRNHPLGHSVCDGVGSDRLRDDAFFSLGVPDRNFQYFFFSSRRRHTSSKRDWSSDVCSSDLGRAETLGCGNRGRPARVPRPRG